MFPPKLKEALNLLGGKAIVADGGHYYVLLTLSEFKKFKQSAVEGLTKQELVDKINNEINIWKHSREEKRTLAMDVESVGETRAEGNEIRYEKSE